MIKSNSFKINFRKITYSTYLFCFKRNSFSFIFIRRETRLDKVSLGHWDQKTSFIMLFHNSIPSTKKIYKSLNKHLAMSVSFTSKCTYLFQTRIPASISLRTIRHLWKDVFVTMWHKTIQDNNTMQKGIHFSIIILSSVLFASKVNWLTILAW